MINKNPYQHFSDYELLKREKGAPVIEVSEDYFIDMLEVLPPCKWTNQAVFETFHISERLTENVVEWLARVREDGKDRWFALADLDTANHLSVITKVKAYIEGHRLT